MKPSMSKIEALRTIAAEVSSGEPIFPASTAVVLKIRDALEDPDCHLERAARLSEGDPLLSARIVATANSVAFNPMGREISDVKTAIGRLGFTTLRSLAMATLTRRMAGEPHSAAQEQAGSQLWEHSTHVAALARVIARKVTHQNPDAAMFAGLIHEIGGFYLISRASEYPALLQSDPITSKSTADADSSEPQSGEGPVEDEALEFSVERDLCLAVLKKLAIPAATLAAIEDYWQGYLAMPPVSMGDTLLLADALAPVASPLLGAAEASAPDRIKPASIEILLGNDTLSEILSESAAEVSSLTRALQA